MSSNRLLRALSLFLFGVALVSAQTIPVGTFKHIIIVIQENRTPDNLFGAAPANPCNSENPFEPGVDIQGGGYGMVYTSTGEIQRRTIARNLLKGHAKLGVWT